VTIATRSAAGRFLQAKLDETNRCAGSLLLEKEFSDAMGYLKNKARGY
jgi:hypothetical protein